MGIFREPAFLLVSKQGLLVLRQGLIQKIDDGTCDDNMMAMRRHRASMSDEVAFFVDSSPKCDTLDD
jgi:hypothetical protein